MSDFEDDIDDQLLELAGATEKKKKRRQPSGSGPAGNAGVSSERKSAGGGKKRKAEYASSPFGAMTETLRRLFCESSAFGWFTELTGC